MRKLAMALVLGSALLAGPALQAREKLTGEQQLDKLLEGRVAGRPVSCIPLSSSSDSQIIDKTAIVYDSGRTIYVPDQCGRARFRRHHGDQSEHQPAVPSRYGADAQSPGA